MRKIVLILTSITRKDEDNTMVKYLANSINTSVAKILNKRDLKLCRNTLFKRKIENITIMEYALQHTKKKEWLVDMNFIR